MELRGADEEEVEEEDEFVEGRSAQLDTERDLAAPGSVQIEKDIQ